MHYQIRLFSYYDSIEEYIIYYDMIYIVSYDLVEPGQNYERLISLIKQESAWAKLGGSAYLIDSDETAVALRDKFRQAIDNNDILYIGVVKAPAAWIGLSNEVSNWIKKHLEF